MFLSLAHQHKPHCPLGSALIWDLTFSKGSALWDLPFPYGICPSLGSAHFNGLCPLGSAIFYGLGPSLGSALFSAVPFLWDLPFSLGTAQFLWALPI